jgi:hypothetical protein
VPDLVRTDISDTAIDLAWTASQDVDHFVLQRRLADVGSFADIATPAADVRTYQDADILLGVAHYYRIYAVDALGNWSPASTVVSAGVPMQPIQATHFRPTVDDGVVRWSWPEGTSLLLGSYTWETFDSQNMQEAVPVNATSLGFPAVEDQSPRYNQSLVLRNYNPDSSLGWESEFVFGSTRTTLTRTSLAGSAEWMDATLDNQGQLHVIFKRESLPDLVYLRQDGQSDPVILNSAQTNPNKDCNPHIAMDQGGTAHISFYDQSTDRLTYQSIPPGVNPVPSAPLILDDSGPAGEDNDIVVDSAGLVHVAYRHYTLGQLHHVLVDADCLDGSPPCAIQMLDDSPGAGRFVSITLDAQDDLHLAYHNNTNARYLKAGDAPVDLAVSSGNTGTSIAIDASGVPHVSYLVHIPPAYQIRYLRVNDACLAGSCNSILIDNLANYSGSGRQSMVVDETGSGVISYYHAPSSELRLAVINDACFDPEPNECPQPIALYQTETKALAAILETPGYLNLVFGDDVRYRMLHLRIERRLPSLHVDDVDSEWGMFGIFAGNSAIAADDQGVAHIAYDRSIGWHHMRYRKMDGFSPAITLDQSADGLGTTMSIDVDSGGTPHVSYYDRANDMLKYATVANGIPDVSVIDPDNAGCSSTLKIDPTGVVHLLYCGLNQPSSMCMDPCPELRYLQVGLTDPGVVHSSAPGVFLPYMDLGAGNLPNVAWVSGLYADPVVLGIEYLIVDGSSDPQTLNTGDPSFFISVAADSNGDSHVAYYDVTLEGLVIQQLDPASEPVLLAPSSDVGVGLALAFDPDDVPHLAWFSTIDESLMYLRGDGISLPRKLEYVRRFAGFFPFLSIDLDHQGTTHISFFSAQNGIQMRYIKGRFPDTLTPVRVDKL